MHIDAAIGCVRKGMPEDIERSLALAHLQAKCLAGAPVEDSDPKPPVDFAPEQANPNSAAHAAVQLAQ